MQKVTQQTSKDCQIALHNDVTEIGAAFCILQGIIHTLIGYFSRRLSALQAKFSCFVLELLPKHDSIKDI